ncbi:MAG: hypothetical protein WCG80_19600 [Spirochaetales bacterium]
MSEEKKTGWMVTLLRAQFRNAEAEVMGKSPWVLFGVVLLLTALLTAFPFVNDKQRTAIESTNPGLYPGISSVFKAVADAGWDLHVEKNLLVAGKDAAGQAVPAQTRFGTWLIIVEPAGGSQEVLKAALGSTSGTTVQRIVFFGISHFGILDQTTERQFDGTYDLLQWFGPDSLNKLPAADLTKRFLYMSATATLPQVQAGVSMLMFVQIVFLVFLLGFLLSLSKVQVRGLGVNRLRGVGFTSSLRTAGAVALGPALLICVALWPFTGAGSLSWAAFTLIYGFRIVLVYMGRFRDKKKKGPSRE